MVPFDEPEQTKPAPAAAREKETDEMAKTIAGIEKGKRLDTHYRTTPEQYEYLARLAANSGHNSVQRIIDEMVFRRAWKDELDALRQTQRKIGLKDSEFYHASVRRELGLKVKLGRHRKLIIDAAA